MGAKPFISVIIPVSERHDDLQKLHAAYATNLSDYTPQFIYVIDGDFPEAVNDLRALMRERDDIEVLQLARWFGEATSLTVGLEKATADVLLTLPAYFQVEPTEIPQLLTELEGNDMVVANRFPRVDSTFNRLQTRLFHWVVRLITGSRFNDLGCSARVIRREVLEDLPIYGDQHRFLPILANRKGFRVQEINLRQSTQDPYRRVYAPGVYTRRALDLLTVFFLIKFTQKPLRFFGLLGSGTAILGGLGIALLIVQRLWFGIPLGNRPALLVAALFVVLGVQLFALGLIGELIIFTHARELKDYTVEKVIN